MAYGDCLWCSQNCTVAWTAFVVMSSGKLSCATAGVDGDACSVVHGPLAVSILDPDSMPGPLAVSPQLARNTKGRLSY